MASSTKEALSGALKQMMALKPIDKITVKDLVDICGVNRQTFYYHFDDVYDLLEWTFEEDANRVLPHEIVYSHWREDVMAFFEYLKDNRVFAMNIYNSNSRVHMLRFLKKRLESCVRGFALVVSEDRNIDMQDFEFVVEFYTNCVVGIISQWMDIGMQEAQLANRERVMELLDNSVEGMLSKFQINKQA